MTSLLSQGAKPVLHVVVIGFHHKKGCQVEYSYPPLKDGGEVNSHECPPEWKHLPSLAVPDGAHNYVKDTIYFHLPAREGTHRTVYGVACYRQIDAKELKIKTDDITRSTVQKSVCVLSNLPLYGLIQAKLELITHAYFKELDFSQVSLLEETYNNLNASLTNSLLDGGSQVYLGMDVKDLVQTFRHKVLVLFKLILLERRVLFTGSPVEKLGNSLMSVLSLFPGMIEHGLVESTAYGVHKQISPTTANTKIGEDTEDFLEIRYSGDSRPEVDQYYSNEPESPTIDRGEKLFNVNNTLNNNHSSHCDKEQDKTGKSSPTHAVGNRDDSNLSKLGNRAIKKNSVDSDDGLHCIDDYYARDTSEHKQKVICDSGDLAGVHKRARDNGDKKAKVHRQLSDSTHGKVKVHNQTCDLTSDRKPARRHKSDTEGGRVKVAGLSKEITEVDEEAAPQVSGSQRVVLSDSKDMLLGLAHYEAVQAGKNIPNNGSLIDIEHCSLELQEDYFSSTSLSDGPIPTPDPTAGEFVTDLGTDPKFSKQDLKPEDERTKVHSESVGELDSPESINQIDREDCFSWEDDKLSLTIDTDKADHRLDDMAGLASSFKEISVLDHLSVTEVGDGNHTENKSKIEMKDPGLHIDIQQNSQNNSSPGMKAAAIKNRLTNAFGGFNLKGKLRKSTSRESSEPSTPGSRESSEPPSPARSQPLLPVLQQDELGFPLAIFTKGCVCFPYLSLQYFDLMNDVNIRSFVIGATNMLFRHKRHLTDVVIDVAENKIEIHEKELQKQLMLTTADLRFADILVKAVTGSTDDGYFDGTEWEGNDEWLRAQFRLYLEGMLAAVLADDAKLIEDYGVTFVQCWKTTHNYKVWSAGTHPGWKDVQAGHPCQGHLSVADIKVRLSHTMNNTEGGKKLNAAVSTTGKYVMQTGKAVGGALTQAKSSLSSWFSTWKASQDKDEQEPAEAKS